MNKKENELHQIARDIMEQLNEKYNITNELSLDEYLDEFRGMLIEAEIDEILECLEEFNKIYLYTNHMNSEEDIIRSLIHECVHSTQSYEIYEEYYKCDLNYETHPYEIEARNAEENWYKYKIEK